MLRRSPLIYPPHTGQASGFWTERRRLVVIYLVMRQPLLRTIAVILSLTASQATTQNSGGRYPESFRIMKDGTTVLLEDYASAPRSAPTIVAATRPPNDFEGLPYQLARVNVLISEPANAPGAASP